MSDDDAVTVSTAEFQCSARLERHDRRVIAAGALSERQVDAIRNARVPDQYADLNREIKD
jgi:hypothetical protein